MKEQGLRYNEIETKNYAGNSTKTGVYQIISKIDNKRYIGSTKSSFHSRKTKHLGALAKNNHFNSHLQRAYNKYGINNFLFEVLEICSKSECVARESFLIDKYKSYDRKYGYNNMPVAPYKHGFKHRDDVILEKSKAKIRKASTLTAFESDERGLPTPINVYDLDGNFIKTFNSQRDACMELNMSISHLCTFLRGRKLKVKDYIVLYANDTLSEDDICKVKSYEKKKVRLYEIAVSYKEVGVFDSAEDCAEEIGCKGAEVRMCCTNKRSRIGNYITKYLDKDGTSKKI